MADLVIEIVVAFLCVMGVVCLAKSVYDRIYRERAEKNFSIELVFHGETGTQNMEYILKKAKYIQKVYYPYMQIRVEDTGFSQHGNQMDQLFRELQIQYEGGEHGREKVDMHQRNDGSGGLPK